MKKRLLALCCALAVAGAATAKIVGATSPGGNLRLEIEVADKISYTVWSGADKVLDACTLSLTLDDRTLGEAPRLRSVKRSSADEMLERRNPTKDAVVRNCYNAVQLRFAGDYAVEFRLFDDGVAYRFVTSLPGEVEVLGEECRLGLPAGSEAWLSEVNGFRSMYEEPYTRVAMAEYTCPCWSGCRGARSSCWLSPMYGTTPACSSGATDGAVSNRFSRACRRSTAPMATAA